MCAETSHARLSPPKLGEAEAVANMPAALRAGGDGHQPGRAERRRVPSAGTSVCTATPS